MTDQLSIEINTDRLQQAIRNAPRALEREMSAAIVRVTKEIARDAHRNAPKATSLLRNSINDTYPSPYEGIVAPGVDYAQAVEEGTHGQPMPPVQNIEDWIAVRRIVPNDPDMTPHQLAFVMARSIAHRGTPAQPYMVPALESNRVRAERRLNAAIDRALRAVQ